MKASRLLNLLIALIVAAGAIALLTRKSAPKESRLPGYADLPAAQSVGSAPAERQRHVNFSEITLKNIAAHFAAESGRKITVSPEVARLKLSGSITINNVDSFLTLLPRVFPVRMEAGEDGAVQILPKDGRE